MLGGIHLEIVSVINEEYLCPEKQHDVVVPQEIRAASVPPQMKVALAVVQF